MDVLRRVLWIEKPIQHHQEIDDQCAGMVAIFWTDLETGNMRASHTASLTAEGTPITGFPSLPFTPTRGHVSIYANNRVVAAMSRFSVNSCLNCCLARRG